MDAKDTKSVIKNDSVCTASSGNSSCSQPYQQSYLLQNHIICLRNSHSLITIRQIFYDWFLLYYIYFYQKFLNQQPYFNNWRPTWYSSDSLTYRLHPALEYLPSSAKLSWRDQSDTSHSLHSEQKWKTIIHGKPNRHVQRRLCENKCRKHKNTTTHPAQHDYRSKTEASQQETFYVRPNSKRNFAQRPNVFVYHKRNFDKSNTSRSFPTHINPKQSRNRISDRPTGFRKHPVQLLSELHNTDGLQIEYKTLGNKSSARQMVTYKIMGSTFSVISHSRDEAKRLAAKKVLKKLHPELYNDFDERIPRQEYNFGPRLNQRHPVDLMGQLLRNEPITVEISREGTSHATIYTVTYTVRGESFIAAAEKQNEAKRRCAILVLNEFYKNHFATKL